MNQIEKYKKEQLPSDKGVLVEETHGNQKSFIPEDAIEISTRAREKKPEDLDDIEGDEYSQERVATKQPAVDSSDETMGGS